MTVRLTWETLEGVAGTAWEGLAPSDAALACEQLGWLSPWWLRSEVVARALEYQPNYAPYGQRPALPTRPGGCWVLFVQRGQRLPLIRPAFLLPLNWERGIQDDPHLPLALRNLADLVRSQQRQDPGGPWGLRLARPAKQEPVDLSGLEESRLGVESAWASLTGGLLLARDGLAPAERVWASAAWDARHGVGQVDGVAEKLDLAAEWGAETVFLPAQNEPQASQWRTRRERGPEVRLLNTSYPITPPTTTLEAYLELVGAEPGPDASREVCLRYHARLRRDRAEAFHWNRLLIQDIARCKQTLHPECRPTHLVTVVSETPSVVAMAACVLGVRSCLLLHMGTPEGRVKRTLAKVRDYLENQGVRCETAPFGGDSFLEQRQQIAEAVAEFVGEVHGEALAFDLTPGFKVLSLALEAVAPPGAWLLYCGHRLDEAKQAVPGSQRYDCWRKGS